MKKSVRYAALAVDNPSFSKKFENMGTQMADGGSLKEAMKQAFIFPAVLLRVAGVGEISNRLDYTLSEASKYFTKNVDISLNALITFMHVLLFMFLVVIVGCIVIAMYLPIFKMASVVG